MPNEPAASSTGAPKLARAGGASAAAASTATTKTPARVMPRQRSEAAEVAQRGRRPAVSRRTQRDAKMPSMRVISLEDHFWTPDIATAIGALRNPDAASGTPLEANLADLGERRL